ncbi:MAG: c-type cytochrome [Rhodoferax sp.]|nr:c-type cytochrome [Rhodoferax sp.]
MKKSNWNVSAAFVALALISGTCFSQGQGPRHGQVDFGKSEFEASCASCHGVSGKGDGTLRPFLVRAPSDLTTLAKRNGSVFPTQRVWEIIDGRGSVEIGPHGSRDMPIWGQIYRSEDTQPYELHVRVRISALLDYLSRIQEK